MPKGLGSGFLGVLIFSGSLPATRVAIAAIDPAFLTYARAAIAGLLAAGLLGIARARLPARAAGDYAITLARCDPRARRNAASRSG